MRLLKSFHYTIATSKFSLPVVVLLSVVGWILLNGETADAAPILTDTADYGLWRLVPEVLTSGTLSVVLALMLSALAVYLMTELNNMFVLLRISSRMLGSMLAVMLTVSVFLHTLHPAHVVMLFVLLSYFPMFASYQQPDSMAYIFVAYMLVSLASLAFPKVLLMVPFYWLAQMLLRAFTPRTLAASVIGLIVPYWITFSFAYVNDCLPTVFGDFIGSFTFSLPDYSAWTMQQTLTALFAFLLVIVGVVNFYAHGNLDKTRTRVFLNVVVLLTFASFGLLVWETSHFIVLFPLVLINTAIISGHHIGQSFSLFDNIYTIVVLLMLVALIVLEVAV